MDSRRLSRTAMAILLVGSLAVSLAAPVFAQEEAADSGPAAAASGLPAAPGSPEQSTDSGVLGDTAPDSSIILPDSPSTPGLTTATEIYEGTGAPGTGAGSGATTASGGGD